MIALLLACAEPIGFEPVGAARGLAVVQRSGTEAKRHVRETLGQGLCWLDADRDGDLDLFAANGAAEVQPRYGPGHPALLPQALYRADGGRFAEVWAELGPPIDDWVVGCAVGDADGDGWTDLVVTTATSTVRLLRNRGGRFVDATAGSGLDDVVDLTTGAVLHDLDGDGDLDLFVAAYLDESRPPPGPCTFKGLDVMCGPTGYPTRPARLYLNDGLGRFRLAASSGVAEREGFGLGVLVLDVEADGRPDVYVANDSTPKHLFRNRGDGRFEEAGLLAGVALSETGRSQAGMGVDAGDLDGDGREDLVVTNFSDDTNNVYRAEGGGFYRDVAAQAGVAAASFTRLGWSVLLEDFDLDGDLDQLVVNGHVFPEVDDARSGTTWLQAPQLMLNDGAGHFVEAGPEVVGEAFREPVAGRAAAVADVDRDGDFDVVIGRDGRPPELWINHLPPSSATWLGLELVGPAGPALGAEARVEAGGRTQVHTVRATRGYLSASEPALRFGLAGAGTADVEVRWPGGERTRHPGLTAGSIVTLSAPGPAPDPAARVARLRNRGAARFHASDLEGAAADFAAAAEACGDCAVDRLDLSIVAWRQGRFAEALDGLSRAVEQDPDLAGAWYVLGLVRKATGDVDGAAAALGRAVELAPSAVEARYQLALLRETSLDAVLEADPTHLGARYQELQRAVRAADPRAARLEELVLRLKERAPAGRDERGPLAWPIPGAVALVTLEPAGPPVEWPQLGPVAALDARGPGALLLARPDGSLARWTPEGLARLPLRLPFAPACVREVVLAAGEAPRVVASDGARVAVQEGAGFTVRPLAGALALADLDQDGRTDLVGADGAWLHRPEGLVAAEGPVPPGLARCGATLDVVLDRPVRLHVADGRVQAAPLPPVRAVALSGARGPPDAHGSRVELQAGTRRAVAVYDGRPVLLPALSGADVLGVTWANQRRTYELAPPDGDLARVEPADVANAWASE